MSDQNSIQIQSENEDSSNTPANQQDQMTTNLTTDDFDLEINFQLPKMPAVPKPKFIPEPISPVSSEQDNKNKSPSPATPKEGKNIEPFIEPPEVFDNVGKDFAPLKHTSMLTEKDKTKKEDEKGQQKPKKL
ncbi:hypothetical protein Mgra_00003926 [Meloidogyne graminicola]|nr:hypothetical protein Mgra_00003926 [Meloidogyne graminicola]